MFPFSTLRRKKPLTVAAARERLAAVDEMFGAAFDASDDLKWDAIDAIEDRKEAVKALFIEMGQLHAIASVTA